MVGRLYLKQKLRVRFPSILYKLKYAKSTPVVFEKHLTLRSKDNEVTQDPQGGVCLY